MKTKNTKTIWIVLTALLFVVCVVQTVIILKYNSEQSPESKIIDNFDRFSFFLNDKYKKEKNDAHRLFDQFFDDDFFSGKSDPFNEMEKLHRRMEKMMDEDIRSQFNDTWNGWLDERFPIGNSDIDVSVKEKENKDNYVFTFEIPELKENNVNIDINKNGITLKGEFLQTLEKKDAEGSVIGKHEMHRTFSKVIPIPEGADYTDASTEHHKNKIIVTMPKVKS